MWHRIETIEKFRAAPPLYFTYTKRPTSKSCIRMLHALMSSVDDSSESICFSSIRWFIFNAKSCLNSKKRIVYVTFFLALFSFFFITIFSALFVRSFLLCRTEPKYKHFWKQIRIVNSMYIDMNNWKLLPIRFLWMRRRAHTFLVLPQRRTFKYAISMWWAKRRMLIGIAWIGMGPKCQVSVHKNELAMALYSVFLPWTRIANHMGVGSIWCFLGRSSLHL